MVNDISWIDSSGKAAENQQNAEISVHWHVKESKSGIFSVSIYMVNRAKLSKDADASEYCVFQPQIRVVCVGGAKIIPMRDNVLSHDEETEMQYRGREFLARGHMTSAMWKDIDPEIACSDKTLDFSECKSQPGFFWIDGELLNDTDCARFSNCDVRTEFVPMYSIPSPDLEVDWDIPPELEASKYASEYNSSVIRKYLEPFDTQYEKWIKMLHSKNADHAPAKSNIINLAEMTHERIKKGIDMICNNGDVRLAFCFANKAMDQQAVWSGRASMKFRPFQLAFVLASMESVLNPASVHRNTCDLLWVPTGAGKTEAYLFLVAMTAAYRRLTSMKEEKASSGAGVSIISRYTLKLLTIQQFRRTLLAFTAMEYLRVYNLERKKRVGWRPNNLKDESDFLWGTTPFSVGLWVGIGVTPNKLDDSGKYKGAISILKHVESSTDDSMAEPAQIIECPACQTVLSVPKNGLSGKHRMH